MRKKLVLAVVLLLGILLSRVAWASQPITLTVNGVVVKTDVAPQIIDGRTIVPIRAVAEALGAEVSWYPATNTVAVSKQMSPKLLKVDGEQTTWPCWHESGKLYMERRNCIELLRIKYPPPWYVVGIVGSTLSINNNSYYIPGGMNKGDFELICLNEIAFKGIIHYQWQPEAGNLTFVDK